MWQEKAKMLWRAALHQLSITPLGLSIYSTRNNEYLKAGAYLWLTQTTISICFRADPEAVKDQMHWTCPSPAPHHPPWILANFRALPRLEKKKKKKTNNGNFSRLFPNARYVRGVKCKNDRQPATCAAQNEGSHGRSAIQSAETKLLLSKGADRFDLRAGGCPESFLSTCFEQVTTANNFFHEPSVRSLLHQCLAISDATEPIVPSITDTQRALVLSVLATGVLYERELSDSDDMQQPKYPEQDESYFRAGQGLLARDAEGQISLISDQARLVACFYLTSTCRPEDAWYMLDTAAGTIIALDRHRCPNCVASCNLVEVDDNKENFLVYPNTRC